MLPGCTLGENGLKFASNGLEPAATVSTPLGPELEVEPEPPLPQAAAAASVGARTRADTARHLDLIVEPHFATPGFGADSQTRRVLLPPVRSIAECSRMLALNRLSVKSAERRIWDQAGRGTGRSRAGRAGWKETFADQARCTGNKDRIGLMTRFVPVPVPAPVSAAAAAGGRRRAGRPRRQHGRWLAARAWS